MERKGDILYDLLDSEVGNWETYEKVTNWWDDTPMDDSKSDGVLYRKSGTEYFKKTSLNLRPISVKEFGAIGDGLTDDTAAIQKALDTVPDGAALLFNDDSSFSISSVTITGKSNVSLVGRGRILPQPSGSSNALLVRSCLRMTISGITVDGNSSTQGGIDLQDSPLFTIDGVSVLNIGDGVTGGTRGILISYGCDYGTIRNSNVKNIIGVTTARGIYVANFRDTTKMSRGVLITNNSLENIQPHGDGDGVVIDQQDKDSDAVISNNRFKDIYKSSVKLLSDSCEVYGNFSIIDNIGRCFSHIRSLRNKNNIHSNTAICYGDSNYENGIIIGGTDVRCVNNTIINSPTSDIVTSDGIVISETAGVDQFNLVISGNTIINARHGIASIADLFSPLITNNTFIGVTNNIINAPGTFTNFKVDGNYAGDGFAQFFICFGGLTNGTVSNNYSEKNLNVFVGGSFNRSIEVTGNKCPSKGSVQETRNGLRIDYGNAAPTSGDWEKGDRIWNNNPFPFTPAGWICTTAGTPGTWYEFGKLENDTQIEITGTSANLSLGKYFYKTITADLLLSLASTGNRRSAEISIINGDTNPHTVTLSGHPFPDGANNEIPSGGRAHISVIQINGVMDTSIVIYS